MNLDLLTTFFEKIAFSGVNGKVLILPLIGVIWLFIGQAKECIEEIKEVFREEDKVTSN